MFRTVKQTASPHHGTVSAMKLTNHTYPSTELQGITWSKEKMPEAVWHMVLVI